MLDAQANEVKYEKDNTLKHGGYLAETQPRIYQRFVVAVYVCMAAFALSMGNAAWFLYNNYEHLAAQGSALNEIVNVALMLIEVVGLFIAIVLARRKQIAQSVRTCCALLTLGLLAITYLNGGFAQAALLGFSIVVVVSSFFGDRRLGFMVTAAFSLGVLCMYLLGKWGVSPPVMYREQARTGLFFYFHEAVYVWVILIASHITASAIVDDFKALMLNLEKENDKVLAFSRHLRLLTMQDPLTQLHNRVFCEQYFEQLSARDPAYEEGVALCFVDLDDFKHINAKYGHLGGDEVLKVIAERLGTLAGEFNGEVARIGGDEFLIWLIGEDIKRSPQLLERSLKVLAQPVSLASTAVSLTASIGIAERNNELGPFWEIVREADIAMREAKRRGGALYAYYRQAAGEQVMREFDLLNELKTALAEDHLSLYYQPQIEFSTNKVVLGEALIRWKREGGEIEPGEFIPIAEGSELIVDITNWVLDRACSDCRAWQETGAKVQVSVNVSPSVFEQADVAEMVENALAKSGLPAEELELEITESLMMRESSWLKEQLSQIERLGVSLAVDDFGVGYSNLAALAWVRFNKLKIDRRFIRGLTTSSVNQGIVRTIVNMARTFDMKVIAEGVETNDEADMVKELECEYGQGFLWARPASLDKFRELFIKPSAN